MKIIYCLIFCFFFSIAISIAQPQGINYQGIARDSVGHPVQNQNISLRLSILDGSATGLSVYVETQNVLTSSSGLFNVSIGIGSVVSGVFATVPWETGEKWLKVEMDLGGGSNYVLIGTTQFMSVPYSLYSKSSGNGMPSGINNGDMLYWNGSAWIEIPIGSDGNSLTLCNGIPTWGGCPISITTNPGSIITQISATSGGNITNVIGTHIFEKGVCYSTSTHPTINDSKTVDGNGSGSYTSNLLYLTQNTTYYVRAYAVHIFGTAYGNEISFNTSPNSPIPSIGSAYLGGVLAYVLQSGDPGYDANVPHGLIAAPSDMGNSSWGCIGTSIVGTSTSIGSGAQNTAAIVAQCPELINAANFCDDLVLNGYNDWYLPSKDELNLLYLNRLQIGGFVQNCYWSSSEISSGVAWDQSFSTGNQGVLGAKPNGLTYRAVRSF